MSDFITTLLLTLKLAVLTTILLFTISLPLAYAMAFAKFRGKAVIRALISLPLVLPPTVIGYYLLVAFNPEGLPGRILNNFFNVTLAFTFEGILVGSLVYSLPFMVHPLEGGFASLSPALKEASYSLGKGRMATLIKVLLPAIKPSILTGLILTFAHTIGEFGIVLMIGGSIPGKTKVVSIAIFNEVEALNYVTANNYSLILFIFSFALLLFVYLKINSSHRNLS